MAFPATLDLVWQGDGVAAPAGQADAVYRGDRYLLTVTHDDGAVPPAAVNVSGRTVLAQVRTDPDGDLLGTFAVDYTDAATGVIVLSLAAADTAAITVGSWYWDYQETSSGVPATIVRGRCDVVGDVSR